MFEVATSPVPSIFITSSSSLETLPSMPRMIIVDSGIESHTLTRREEANAWKAFSVTSISVPKRVFNKEYPPYPWTKALHPETVMKEGMNQPTPSRRRAALLRLVALLSLSAMKKDIAISSVVLRVDHKAVSLKESLKPESRITAS